MEKVLRKFETELKERLNFKSGPHASEETILLKSFKYFDPNNSGTVNLSSFTRAVEKIGIIIFSQKEFEMIFNHYDKNNTGEIDYKKFSAEVLGHSCRITNTI